MDTSLSTTVITNVQFFFEGELRLGSVSFRDGIITNISCEESRPIPSAYTEVIDGRGAMLLPGAIDAHVHFREPGMTDRGDIASESRAAAAGGVTYVMDMPNVNPTTTSLSALRQKAALFREKCVVNYGLFFGITNDNIDEALTVPHNEICGYKVFLGSSTGGMLMNDAAELRRLFSSTNRVIAVHSESEDIIRRNREAYSCGKDDLPINYHPLIRSREACVVTTRQAIKLAKETGANLHLCHISTTDELDLLLCYPADNITAEVCIPHLWFCDADYNTYGAKIKCNPAIKTAFDRQSLREALTNRLVQTVATDHAPHLIESKEGGALRAASGIPSIQFSYITMLELMEQGVLSLADVVRLMCETPAQRFGLDSRGKIAVGYAADLVLVAREFHLIKHADILSKCGWSPFEGEIFHYNVKKTWVNGQLAFDRS